MNRFGSFTSLALAVAGVSFAGCDREETAVETDRPQTEVGRDAERGTDKAIRGTEELAQDIKSGSKEMARDVKEGTRDLADNAKQAGSELSKDTKDAGRDARDAVNNAGNEMDRAGDRTADRANEAGRDVNRNLNDAARDANSRDAAVRTGDKAPLAPNGTAAAPDAEGIRDVLGQVPEATLAQDGFDDLVERFVDADRNRIGKWLEGHKDFSQLNLKAQQLSQKFQQKYSAAFDIDNEDALFNQQFAAIQQSEIGQAQQARGVDINADANRTNDGANVKVDVDNRTGVDNPRDASADANRNDPGRNIATVKVSQSHGLPELTVNMIHEFPGVWKIDLPDQVTGQQLHDNLSKALDEIAQKEGQWPQNPDDAKRFITHRLLLAIHGQSAQ
jgi:hypothetical protein